MNNIIIKKYKSNDGGPVRWLETRPESNWKKKRDREFNGFAYRAFTGIPEEKLFAVCGHHKNCWCDECTLLRDTNRFIEYGEQGFLERWNKTTPERLEQIKNKAIGLRNDKMAD